MSREFVLKIFHKNFIYAQNTLKTAQNSQYTANKLIYQEILHFYFDTELRISSAHISASIIVGAFVFPAMRSGITRMSFQDDHGKIRSRQPIRDRVTVIHLKTRLRHRPLSNYQFLLA